MCIKGLDVELQLCEQKAEFRVTIVKTLDFPLWAVLNDQLS